MHAGQISILSRFLLLIALGLSWLTALTQSTGHSPDLVYGNDPLLYNGRIYSFFPVAGTGGTQYFSEKFDSQGSVVLRGVTYKDRTINYDLYNQQLVLNYKNALGSTCIIEISKAWLELFDFNGRHFEIETGADTTKRIYQVLGDGALKLMYFHRKELLIDTHSASRNHYFSEIIREMYINTDNRLVKYNNNKSFLSVFSKPKQELIKKYLRKQNIKVKRANDNIMTQLINYCNTLNGS
jgi:hypothetical protein